MKKIFRMALVLALAGSALLYTGCTKDYNEDINNLAGQINDLKSLHATDIANLQSALSNLESSLKSADAAIEAGYKAADATLQADLDAAKARISANENAINALKNDVNALQDDVAALQGDVEGLQGDVDANAKAIEALEEAVKKDIENLASQIETDLKDLEKKLTDAFTAADAALQKQIDAILKAAYDALAAAKELVLNELRAIVAIPQAYVEGVEATEYGYTTVYAKAMTKAPKDGEKVYKSTASNWFEQAWEDFIISMAEPEFTYATFPEGAEYAFAAKVDKDKNPVAKTLGQLATAYYDLNPSSFDTNKAEWALYGSAVPFYNVPNVRADEKVWKPVFDTIGPVENSNNFAVKYYVENPELLAADFLAKKLPTMELVASLDEVRDVTSNDLVLYSYTEDFDALAFDSAKKEFTTANACSLGYELYESAVLAVYFKASATCDYRKSLDLAQLITIHMTKSGAEYETTLAKLQEVYPELDMTFELVDYTVGNFETSQSAYAKIDGTVFQPVAFGKESAVNKKPLVLVKLFNGEDIALAGYFKIEIVKDADVAYIDFPAFDTIPYMCEGADFVTTYDQFSSLVIDALSLPYKSFKSSYSVLNTEGKYVALANHSEIPCQVFVKNDKGELVETAKYGEINYVVDAQGAVNDGFVWVLDWDAIKTIGAGKSATVYVKLFDSNYSIVYISFSVSVAPIAHYDFGANKVANRWFDEIDDEAYNTVKLNVPVNAVGADVTDFSKDLDQLFAENKPAVVLKETSDNVYFNEKGEAIIDAVVAYEFSKKQPEVAGYQLVYGPDVKPVAQAKTELYVAYLASEDAKANSYALVAEIKGSVLEYAESPMAKKLLNEYSHKATAQTEMLYANIQANIAYGTKENHCVPCDTATFHARFLRPLSIEWGAQTINEESQTDGANVYVKKFFKSIVDWNGGQKVIDVLDEDGKEVYKDHIEKGLNMFAYYKFSNITVDLANATRDNANTEDLTKKVKCTSVGDVLQLGTVNATTGQFTPSGSNEVIFSGSFDGALANVAINYKNNSVNQKEFKVWVPATISYYWGTFETTLEITIKNTTETQPL